MPIEVLMPALSPTMTEGKLTRWLKQEGDQVSAGDAIAEVETDKATMEIEATADGTLGKILVPENAEGVAVNTPIALLLEEGEDAAALEAAAPESAEAPESVEAPAAPVEAPPPTPATPAAPAKEAPAEPEGTGATITQTVREALRDAMAEEMRRDETVFLMGEEVAKVREQYDPIDYVRGLLIEGGHADEAALKEIDAEVKRGCRRGRRVRPEQPGARAVGALYRRSRGSLSHGGAARGPGL